MPDDLYESILENGTFKINKKYMYSNFDDEYIALLWKDNIMVYVFYNYKNLDKTLNNYNITKETLTNKDTDKEYIHLIGISKKNANFKRIDEYILNKGKIMLLVVQRNNQKEVEIENISNLIIER